MLVGEVEWPSILVILCWGAHVQAWHTQAAAMLHDCRAIARVLRNAVASAWKLGVVTVTVVEIEQRSTVPGTRLLYQTTQVLVHHSWMSLWYVVHRRWWLLHS